MTTDAPELLTLCHITVKFAGMAAIDDLSLTVRENARMAVIGPNGAGKSTLLKAIAGEQGASAGEIVYAGRQTRHVPSYRRARAGVVRTRQDLGLFWSMTVEENIAFGADNPRNRRMTRDSRDGPKAGRQAGLREVMEWLDLAKWRDHRPDTLPYGVRKRVELARALTANPRLLLLDEPVAGLNTREKAEMVERIAVMLTHIDTALILVEHDMQTVQALCPDEVQAMVAGRIVASGTFDTVIRDPDVVEAYFGTS